MNTLLRAAVLIAVFFMLLPAQTIVPARRQMGGAEQKDEDFVIKKPGEITFTSGIVIEGRVEKPQVMLVLTKEKIKVEAVLFQQSFLKNITDPLRYNTFEISNGGGEEMGDTEGRKSRRNQ